MEGNATVSSIFSWSLFWFLLMQHRDMIEISLSMAFSVFKSNLMHFYFPFRQSLLKLLCFFPVLFQCTSPSSSSSSVLCSCTNITSYPVFMSSTVKMHLDEGSFFSFWEKYVSVLVCFSEEILISLGRGWIKSIKLSTLTAIAPSTCI